ncbi:MULTISPECIES: acyl-CoA dehydrogenase C-terminal domain-containing protein [unclassified Psychrobacter]|uniref:acyl-CoA dehydrogenase C-terminal domain-containing protein n=1 Tax=unclassified Psychrobacter TaxID=196806 RepID=UPI0018F66693|nr:MULTISPECIES: acyl-CoA dehydrogenase C-terminal domain-containing protein [unclassified Psychrobacter]
MHRYHAPLADMRFLLTDVFDAPVFWQTNKHLSHVDMDTVEVVLEALATFTQKVLLPLNHSGDKEGVSFALDDMGYGAVRTPTGFKAAYAQYKSDGWVGLGATPEYGGQGFPKMVSMFQEEMMFSSNQSFALYPNLALGAGLCLLKSASEEQKQRYLEKIYTGEWAGTMCLTEAHAGTDLGLLKTKAVPNDDGSYAITGSKIFVTGGDHDLTDNIIHLVLAKTPNAPAGSKGISLFIVPKFLLEKDEAGNDQLGARNAASVGSVEHKMGVKGSATCVLNFDKAKGWLVGEECTGLASMFLVMNYERLAIGIQGIALTELAYQNAAAYANDRLQSRSDSGIKNPDKDADALIHHADIRRMLLNAKAHAEISRCFAMYVAKQLDIAKYSDDKQLIATANARIALLTPITKAFLSDKAFEATVDCQQVFGGHGYICDWGMEQIVRDTRIAQIYEGANGIQALDLLGRKVAKDNGAMLFDFLAEIRSFIGTMSGAHGIKQATLTAADDIERLTHTLLANISARGDEMNGCAVNYLHATGYLCFAYMSAMMVAASQGKAGAFYANKLKLADYFMAHILPRMQTHIDMVQSGSTSMMAFDLDYFDPA